MIWAFLVTKHNKLLYIHGVETGLSMLNVEFFKEQGVLLMPDAYYHLRYESKSQLLLMSQFILRIR